MLCILNGKCDNNNNIICSKRVLAHVVNGCSRNKINIIGADSRDQNCG